jgi:NAD+ synthase|tara:strand:+ start:271 stop:1011 length:741 start_codon:yes stop_codon:yes gene_type:complete
MKTPERIQYIKNWIIEYCRLMPKEPDSLVVGVSGGIDSSVVSAICSMTEKKTFAVSMPIQQNQQQHNLSLKHHEWLKNKYKNIETPVIPLDNIFKDFQITLSNFNNLHGFANLRSRIRMIILYQIAQSNNGIVVGTGNKVEDFGVGFFTKYGDGGVDIAPIADCTKTEIWDMGKDLGILKEIIDAVPTDGLWDDARTDETQLGLSYKQIEAAMINSSSKYYKKYSKIRKSNLHKMKPVPVCKIRNK